MLNCWVHISLGALTGCHRLETLWLIYNKMQSLNPSNIPVKYTGATHGENQPVSVR